MPSPVSLWFNFRIRFYSTHIMASIGAEWSISHSLQVVKIFSMEPARYGGGTINTCFGIGVSEIV
jgi:hypothetical protein